MADETKLTVVKSNVANALSSAAADHVIAVADDIYDEDLGRYQSDINKDIKTYNEGFGIEITPDNTINSEVYYQEGIEGDDAARVILGGDWRMPTIREYYDLIENSTFTQKTINGVVGIEAQSKLTSETLFFPYTGYKYDNRVDNLGERAPLWTSELNTYEEDENGYGNAENADFMGHIQYVGDSPHWIGLPIRPVSNKLGIDMGLSVRWAESNLTATGLASSKTDFGDYFSWAETAPKTIYSDTTYKYGIPNTKYNPDGGLVRISPTSGEGKSYLTSHGDELQTKINPGKASQVLTTVFNSDGTTSIEWKDVMLPVDAKKEELKELYGGCITIESLLALPTGTLLPGTFYSVYDTKNDNVFSGNFLYGGETYKEGTFIKWDGREWIFDSALEDYGFKASYLYNRSFGIYRIGGTADNGKWVCIWQWDANQTEKCGISFINRVVCSDTRRGYSLKMTVDSRSTDNTGMPYSFIHCEYLTPNIASGQDYFGDDPFDLRTFFRVTADGSTYRMYARVWNDINGMSGVDLIYPSWSVDDFGFKNPIAITSESIITWENHLGNEITKINYGQHSCNNHCVELSSWNEHSGGDYQSIFAEDNITVGKESLKNIDLKLPGGKDEYFVYVKGNCHINSITPFDDTIFNNGTRLHICFAENGAIGFTQFPQSLAFNHDGAVMHNTSSSCQVVAAGLTEQFVFYNNGWYGLHYTTVYTTDTISGNTEDLNTLLPPTSRAVYDYIQNNSGAPAEHTHKSSEITSMEDYEKASSISEISTTDTLNSAIGKLEKVSDIRYSIHNANNVINANIDITLGGYISQATHEFVSDTSGRFKCSGPISVRGASTIEFSANAWCNHTNPDDYDLVQLVFLDNDMNVIPSLDIRVDDIVTRTINLSEEIYSDVYYVILSGDQNGYAVPRTFLRIKGSVDLNSFISKNELGYHQGYNLFDVNRIEYKKGINSSGAFIDDSQAMVSNLIELPDDRGRNNGMFLWNLPTTSYTKRFVYYDKDMNIVAGPGDIAAGATHANIGCREDAKYFRISIIRAVSLPSEEQLKEDLKNVMITLQYAMSEYQPYHREIETIDGERIAASSLAGLYTGKKWAVMGDSLTEHNERSTKFYYEYVKEELGMSIVNLGMSGTGYMSRQDVGDAFYQRVETIPSDIDVLTIFGSFNDLTQNFSLGNITDTETTTICGCINKTLDDIFTAYPTINIGIISPCPWKDLNPSGTTTDSKNAINYVACLKEICEKRSIPFLDLFHGSGLRPWDRTFRSIYYSLDAKTDDDPHGTHPNALGHQRLSTKIKQFIQTLL